MPIYESNFNYRVLYADTDQMKVVYHGNYCRIFEIGRVELMRELGLSYKELESLGVGLAMVNMNITYRKPAFYDDILTVKTSLDNLPDLLELHMSQQIFNHDNKLITKADVILFYIDLKTLKRIEIPEKLLEIFKNIKT
ncbi:MAG: thioesterase family protein [Alphaproteobacteria bacterium]|nr:thioesterase family protein [Alphaproteobacteria bacterium]